MEQALAPLLRARPAGVEAGVVAVATATDARVPPPVRSAVSPGSGSA